MQKRPRGRPYRIVHAPIRLPEDFSIQVNAFHRQGDRPITWLHVHDCMEVGYCYEGAGIFVIGSKVLPFRAGDVSIITSAEVHLAQSAPGTSSRWAWIYFDPFRLLRGFGKDDAIMDAGPLAGPRFRNLISPRRDAFVGALVRELVTELRENPRGYRTSARGLVASLLARLRRLAPSRQRRSQGNGEIEPAMRRIAPALDQMAENHAAPADARAWARSCHMSVTHFRRLFRQALRKSPHQYLIELRVLMAASRLQTEKGKIVDIAYEAGFTTLSSFNRSFRRVMGVTPRKWRLRRR
jgi:AraC-like DNA-binding protein